MYKYTLQKGATLGKGGTAKVYKCQDGIGIRGVCKVMSKTEVSRSKVHQEVTFLQELAYSPKVVKLYDALETDTDYYIIMEWCRGGAVRDYTSNYTLYSENTVASILRGVLRGLVHVHNSGIIHRDIKPGNVLLSDSSEDAEVKLTDFGSAIRYEGAQVEVNDLVGTPWFMSPETLRSVLSPKSDIWSVGVMSYQLLTGLMPFDDPSAQPKISQIWNAILTKEPKWIGKRWESISDEAKDFVKLCLNKDISSRPTAMEALDHPWLQGSSCTDRFCGIPIKLNRFIHEDNTLMNAKTWSMDYIGKSI